MSRVELPVIGHGSAFTAGCRPHVAHASVTTGPGWMGKDGRYYRCAFLLGEWLRHGEISDQLSGSDSPRHSNGVQSGSVQEGHHIQEPGGDDEAVGTPAPPAVKMHAFSETRGYTKHAYATGLRRGAGFKDQKYTNGVRICEVWAAGA